MSIRYDEKRVKRPYAEHEYTNEEILELEKCSKDVNAFIKHLKIINPDRGEELFKPYDYQWKLLDLMANNRFVISLQSRQSGKCIFSDTMIKIRNKKTGNVEDVTIGKFFERMKK